MTGEPAEKRPWDSPPGTPYPYRLRDRLADACHGFRDGKRGIPLIERPDEQAPQDAPTPRVSTPRIASLSHAAREAMEAERERCEADCLRLVHRLRAAQAHLDGLPDEAEAVEPVLKEVREPPGEKDLTERRTAEADPQQRPEALVRERRLRAHARRRAEAQARVQRMRRRRAEAEREVAAVRDEIDTRRAIARATARRIREHALRRIATYLQHLVRAHPDGGYISTLLDRVGPDLPSWAREPADDGREPGGRTDDEGNPDATVVQLA